MKALLLIMLEVGVRWSVGAIRERKARKEYRELRRQESDRWQ